MGRSRELAELATGYDSGGGFGFKNRIINGDMRIDQRNAGASVNPSTGAYTLDRWFGGGVHDGVLGVQRVADAPTGFVNSLRVTVSTADASLGATQYARIGQPIEGFNVADFAGGTASAATITFSFWVKSSLTGTFGGYIANGDESRIYIFQYTINAASTWEQKTVTLTLATNGTWATDNSAGMRAFFSLGAGSSYIGTANTWLTSYAQQASGNINVINTINATWQITGVQLESGTVASPFERRDYGRELMMCMRYYETQSGYNTLIYSDNALASGTVPFTFSVVKRANPTIVLTNPSGTLSNTGTQSAVSISTARFEINVPSSSGAGIRGGFNNNGSFTASIEL